MEKVSLVCGTSLEAVGAKSNKAGNEGPSKAQSLVWTLLPALNYLSALQVLLYPLNKILKVPLRG